MANPEESAPCFGDLTSGGRAALTSLDAFAKRLDDIWEKCRKQDEFFTARFAKLDTTLEQLGGILATLTDNVGKLGNQVAQLQTDMESRKQEDEVQGTASKVRVVADTATAAAVGDLAAAVQLTQQVVTQQHHTLQVHQDGISAAHVAISQAVQPAP